MHNKYSTIYLAPSISDKVCITHTATSTWHTLIIYIYMCIYMYNYVCYIQKVHA